MNKLQKLLLKNSRKKNVYSLREIRNKQLGDCDRPVSLREVLLMFPLDYQMIIGYEEIFFKNDKVVGSLDLKKRIEKQDLETLIILNNIFRNKI